VKTFTQEQVIEMTMAVIKTVRRHTDLSEEELVKSVSEGMVKGLESAGAVLLWRRSLRKN
jgi:hypothetical protein